MTSAETRSGARPRAELPFDVGVMVVALLLFALVQLATGRIEVNGGRGWDGVDYGAMLADGWNHGSANAALRPLIVMLNRPAYHVLGSVVRAFAAMDVVYLAAFYLAMTRLFERYSDSRSARVLVVANLAVCIATAKYVAYYPVLVDAGAYALVVIALLFILAGHRAGIVASTVAVVLAREFAIAVVAFGIVRELRRRVPVHVVLATYAPALIVFVGWRRYVAHAMAAAHGAQPLSISVLLDNLKYWHDPVYVGLFAYFALTIAGGIGLFVLARGAIAGRHLVREPEWFAYMAVILAAAAAGDADMWRYLAYLIPALVVLFAVALEELPTRARWVSWAVVSVATLATQRPWQHVTVPTYFRDWFPYYIEKGTNLPFDGPVPSLWPVWGWRFVVAAALFWILTMCVTLPVTRSAHADRA